MKTLLLLFFCYLGIEPLVAVERAVKATPMQHSSPFAFRENKGQIANKDFIPQPDVLFQAKGKGVTLFLMKDRVVYQYTKITYPKGYQFHREKDAKKTLDTLYRREQDSIEKQILTETFRMDMVFLNANKNPTILKENKTQDYENYYLAQCPEGATHVYGYTKITYKNLYPNIDWVIYTVDNDSSSASFKYDFIVHPGGNPKDIQLAYTDIDSIQKLENGNIRIVNPLGIFEDQKPISFQGNSKISSEFLVNKNNVSFHIEAYDPKQTLVIDPLNRVWATYYGGAASDNAKHCSVDTFANIYIVGDTYSNSFISSNGYQNISGGNLDAFITKFNKEGVRQWATYYGGSSSDMFYFSSIDNQNNVYACGSTFSSLNIAFNGFQNIKNGNWDNFLVKFDGAGLRQWATYYGGNDYENEEPRCTTDKIGNVYLCGISRSINNISSGGFQNSLDGFQNSYLVKFNSLGTRLWATYYGKGSEISSSVTIDSLGNVYLVGSTYSNGLAFNGYQSSVNGVSDIFLVKFNSIGVRQWATYYGGNNEDLINNCVVDQAQCIYIAGTTKSITNFALNGHQSNFGGGFNVNDAFLIKFSNNGIPLWATYYGGDENENYGYCAVDKDNNVFLAGLTKSVNNIASNGYMNNLSATNIGQYFSNSEDAFLAKFNSNGIRQWGTYFGDTSSEYNRACAIDKYGGLYLAGTVDVSCCSHIGYNGHQNTPNGGSDAYLVKFKECNSSTFSFDSIICVNHPIWFNNQFISDSGTYKDTLVNASYCDSFIFLHLTVKDYIRDTQKVYYCGNSYLGKQSSGFYSDTIATGSCDSISVIDLTLYKNDSTHLLQEICKGTSFFFNNQNRTIAGIYRDTLINFKGCDSFILLHLTVKDYTRDTQKVLFCGTKYLGKQSSGFYSDTIATASCDSISVLDLTLLRSDTTYLQQEICEGSFHPFNNQNLTLAGIYSDTQTNILGCDSFIILDLKVNPKYSISYQQTICKGNSFLFNGVARTQAGFYTQSIKTTKGCDSITTMELIVLDTARFSETKTICVGESYKGYSTTGIHKQYLSAASGCDSVYTLNLTVLNASFNTTYITICKGSSYKGFKDTGVYYLYLYNQYGCDSTVEVHLSFYPPVTNTSKTLTICKGQRVTINHQFISTAGFYTDTLASVNGCDSLVYITLKVLELSPRLSLRDTSICIDDSLKINAPLGYLMYTWNNGTTLPYLWVSQAGQYSLKVMDTNRCLGFDTVQVARYPTQKLIITAPTEVEKADIFVAKAEGNAYKTLQWQPASLFACDTCAQNKLSLTSTTMLYLYYTDYHQCRYKDSLLIDVASYTADFEFPNAFSPNGDNKNDYFYPEGNYGTRAMFQIYNRWGEKVFESSVAKPRWDGTYNGEPQPAGVYSYYGVLTLRSGKTVVRKGTVTLIR
jgi:gliding motility-associated-like protein